MDENHSGDKSQSSKADPLYPFPGNNGDRAGFVASVVDSTRYQSSTSCPSSDSVISTPRPTLTREDVDQRSQSKVQSPAEIPEVEDDKEAGQEFCSNADLEEDEEESEYEYEDDDDAAFSGFLLASGNPSLGRKGINKDPSVPARIIEEEAALPRATAAASLDESHRRKWREPSRAAVNMSLRAQQETTGTKRRLAQDLYRIMNQETEEAGFSLAPQSEDAMDKWTIKLFQFDEDSNLAKDMLVLGIDHIQLEMKFPDQYPFEPPFVRVVKPRFKRQTGFVMNGALCMELLTKDGWNPINDIESVIVSIRSLLVVGDGRLQAAADLSDSKYQGLLKAASGKQDEESIRKRQRVDCEDTVSRKSSDLQAISREQVGTYSAAEAQAAYSHLSDYHKKKGWDTSGWWARKG